MSENINLKELAVSKLELYPGDIVVFKAEVMLQNEQMVALLESFKGVFPENIKVLVLSPGIDISAVLKAELYEVDIDVNLEEDHY